MLSALDRKLLRDLRRLWAQALAISLVVACGVATIIISVGSYRSLDETRRAYYERYRFAEVFASATRAPRSLAPRIAAIPGVAAAELRIREPLLLDIPAMLEPATGLAISLPDRGEPAVNRLRLASGRLPRPGATDEVAVNASFAIAHRMGPGDSFEGLLRGTKLSFRIVGTVYSPEFIYAIGPADLVPDDRRFGLLYLSERALEALAEQEEAFNDVALRLLRGADEAAVIEDIDRLLAPYGGTGAYGRKDQMSHAFLDGELVQLRAMAAIIPPIFLFVSAFLVNMVLSRLIDLEREQIGLMKALGYGRLAVASHYSKLVIAIALIGIVIGAALGTWLGIGLTRIYGDFFDFPFLIFERSLDLYLLAGGIAAAAAIVGGLRAIWSALRLDPAVAMRPPAPGRFRSLPLELRALFRAISRLAIMGLRNLIRRPLRAFQTCLGVALAVALLVVSLFAFDSIDQMVDTIYFQADRQNASLAFSEDLSPRALDAVRRLPGVLRVEPFRAEAVILRNGPRSRRLSITGKPHQSSLSRVLDIDLEPVVLPKAGLLLTDRVASLLDLRPGERAEVEFLDGRRRQVEVMVSAIAESYLGLMVFMEMGALDRLTGDGPRISGAHLSVDATRLPELYAAVKETPALAGIGLQSVAREKFRETVGENIGTSTVIYSSLAIVIAFGVVFNAARILLSERGRELASLRVLGFTSGEVFRVLWVELAVLMALAQPLGWGLGWLFTWSVVQGLQSDIFRVPMVLEPDTLAISSLVSLAAGLLSLFIVRRRVGRLDLIEVLKTRE